MTVFKPGLEAYIANSSAYRLVPVYKELFTDVDTPITLYKKVCGTEESYLLESVEGSEHLSRYSFIGINPFLRFWYDNKTGYIEENGVIKEETGNPLDILAGIMARFRGPDLPGLPRFYGGAVGYFAYDTIRHIEHLPDAREKSPDLPECCYLLTKVNLIFDHVRHRVIVVANTRPGAEPEKDYQEALALIEEVVQKIKGPAPETPPAAGEALSSGFVSNMTRDDFAAMVVKAKEYIKAGDIFQVVLSQRFQQPVHKAPFDIYRSLRAINPAPYLYYLNLGKTQVIGSSPEMLVRVEGGIAETCPIAGTRPRGRDEEEDDCLAEELLEDEKEKAEHVMLVDLGRNDLGRVCIYESIELTDFMIVEKYSHVMHLVSRIKGKLKPEYTAIDTLKACFPAGTVSGAPKVRAMEIIDELEPTGRGIYAGVVGYFGFSGNMDTCITIRTVVVHEGIAYVQAGAGIVADSDPQKEYEETLNKAGAIFETFKKQEVMR